MNFKKSLLSIAVAGIATLGVAQAANVPAGTELAPKQELIWNNGANPASFDPHKIEGVPEGNVARQVFEGLVTSDEKGQLRPGVAVSWEHSDDFKTWTFHLRKDAKWSNGDPVTAHDFVYAWQRLVDPKTASPYASYVEFLKLKNAKDILGGKKPITDLGVEAKDDYTLVLNLDESVGFADKLSEQYVLYPVNKKVVEKFGDKWTAPENFVGNGAFKIESFTVNDKTVLTRNENYWDNKNTVLDKITLLAIENSATDVQRYRAGDEDITNSSLPVELFSKLKKELPEELKVNPTLCTYTYEFNNEKAPFNDVRVRKALSYAIDRDIITTKILQAGQKSAYGFTPPYIGGGDKLTKPEWASWDAKKRYVEAEKLLSEAGYSKSKPLNFTILYNTNDNHKKLAVAVGSMLNKNLGGAVNVKLENQEWKTYLDNRKAGKFDVARAGWCADYNEATTFLTYFLSDSSNNKAFYKSAEYDGLVNGSYSAKDDVARSEAYAKAEAVLNKDTPFAPVYYYVDPQLVKPWVQGFAYSHPAKNYYLKDVYIIKH